MLQDLLRFVVNLIWGILFLLFVVIVMNAVHQIIIEGMPIRTFFDDFGTHGFRGIREVMDWFRDVWQQIFQ